ncbi:MAG: nucleotidyltransferase family protein [Endomicrobiales bacterium]|nr:nucleotidyltransferase family protein [Endomicrobiales bacterium]
MNKNILVRNLLILSQLEEIIERTSRENIPILLLKGIALIETIPEYSKERVMDDMDLLVKSEDKSRVREILYSLGYLPFKGDPHAFYHPQKAAYVDIDDSVWYLNKKEISRLWERSRKCKIKKLEFHLPPDEFYIHVLAHAAIHHGEKSDIWLKDLELISSEWEKNISWLEVQNKLKRYGLYEVSNVYLSKKLKSKSLKAFVYSWFIKREIPRKGHMLRFIFLPFQKKLNYLIDALFPSQDFLIYRYNIKNEKYIFLYHVLRPFFLVARIFLVTAKLTFHFCPVIGLSKAKNSYNN